MSKKNKKLVAGSMKKYRVLEIGEIFREDDEEWGHITYNSAGSTWEQYHYIWGKVYYLLVGKMVTIPNHYRRPISKRKIG